MTAGVVSACGLWLALGSTAASADPPSAPSSGGAQVADGAAPWRLDTALGDRSWIHLGGTHRIRYEYLGNQFRVGAPGDDMALSLRTTLDLELRLAPLVVGAEAIDSRIYLVDGDTPLDPTLGDALDLLQAFAGADVPDLFQEGASGRIRVGRMTLDVGSRRLVARNRFRNTINAFTGVDAQWTSSREDLVRLFATVPVQRLPTDRSELERNAIELDEESLGAPFVGVFLGSRPLPASARVEAYVFGLHERDRPGSPTRDRRLLTPGARALVEPGRGVLDLELEGVLQVGRSRASTSEEDRDDLRHRAFFVHASLGYTVDAAWEPRVALQHDHATGDPDPVDARNGRFDTLFGARRFELGPTGIFGALARTNLSSPGLRIEVKPHDRVDAFAAYRPAWLAARSDAWSASGIRDESGESGSFVGHQLEVRLRWKALPGNLGLEVGGARLVLGAFPVDAPASTVDGDPTYVYAQLGLEV